MARRGTYRRMGRRGPKRARWRRVAYAAETAFYGVMMVFIGYEFHGFLRQSPHFQVEAVVIEGADALEDTRILEVSGISRGDNIFFFDAERVMEKIESMPYVRSCSVTLMFPDTVFILIEERIPFAALLVNGRAYEIDEECNVLREYGPTQMPKEPFFTNVLGIEFVALGERLQVPALLESVRAWKAFSETAMAGTVQVSEFAAYHSDDIRMYCDEFPYEIRWGRGDFRLQARRLDILWHEKGPHLKCREYLDLRFGRELVCK